MKGDGLSYLYMDESTNGWKVSKETINSKSSTLANTLNPLLDFYDRKVTCKDVFLSCKAQYFISTLITFSVLLQIEGFGYMLYNDQPPKPYAASASYGHSKGGCSNVPLYCIQIYYNVTKFCFCCFLCFTS